MVDASMKDTEKERMQKVEKLASHIMQLACDSIVVNMRFLDVAIAALKKEARYGLNGASTDGVHLYYDPVWLLKHYEKEQGFAVRLYLHILLHCIFYHSYQYGKLDTAIWDLAVDLAVENTVLELNIYGSSLKKDDELKELIKSLHTAMNDKDKEEKYQDSVSWNQMGRPKREKKAHVPFTAEHIYRYLLKNRPLPQQLHKMVALSHMDEHVSWNVKTEMTLGQEQFRRISERIKADLKSFSKDKNNSESLTDNLGEATKDRYDYGEILKRFTSLAEDMGVNDDEFDYIYYHYGMETYKNMPLIEPLEYKEVRKVKEFVIAIDTSASCRGDLVRAFLKKTYSILKQSESFFTQVNVHIIQCDSQIQSDTRITCDEDFEAFMKTGKLWGFGSTDFRPVFDYVMEQIEKHEFENLKGLIYFTDGYGIYPEFMPPFETIFAFLNEDDQKPKVPVWAIEVVLSEPDIEGFETETADEQ